MASSCPADDPMTGRLLCAASVLFANRAEYLGPLLEQGYVLLWIAICTVAIHWGVKKFTPPENDSESWNGFVESTYGDDRDQMGKTSLGSPTAFALGAFATTITTLSCALVEWRGLTTANAFIGNFFFIAGTGMVISAQWELVRGNSYNYTVFSAYGMFYGGFGAILTPLLGVSSTFGDDKTGYNNALGFFCILWTVFNTFFLLGSLTTNIVTIATYTALEIYLCLLGASYFVAADGRADTAVVVKKTAGSFAFVAGMLGYYSMGNAICRDQRLPSFLFPMGDVSPGRSVSALSSEISG